MVSKDIVLLLTFANYKSVPSINEEKVLILFPVTHSGYSISQDRPIKCLSFLLETGPDGIISNCLNVIQVFEIRNR